ncbi:protein-tyrosine phosphatase-like protein [Rhizoctonia solani]|nr:protein-tyrosine phosphatase-like protein [Rhizoctonia solani]
MLPPRQITPHTNTYSALAEVTRILPGLYLSSLSALQTSSLEITHVLSVLDFETELANFSGTRRVVHLSDGPKSDLLSHLDECVQFVQDARREGGMVVVHCLAGLSRSVCIVAACVMLELGIGVKDALEVVRQKRGVCKATGGVGHEI